jgi:uncharacterized protein (DUF433 family)
MARGQVQDSRNAPRYTPREVAHHLAVPVATVRAWSVGSSYGQDKGRVQRFHPLIVPAAKAPLTLSFANMTELYVLTSLRRRHNVPMREVRAALRYTGRELGVERPLLEQTFYTDGVELFVERYSALIKASDGQATMREVLKASLKRVERGDDGRVLRLYPWLVEPDEPQFVELDPERAFGRLVLAGTGVPVEAIAERFGAGESIGELARDYRMNADQIEQALRWEQCSPRAA